MDRGDVVRVRLPRPPGQPGHEQFGERPAIIIQDEPRLATLATVVLVPLTSSMGAMRFAGSLEILPDSGNGLTMRSVILTQQIRAVDRSRIANRIGRVSDDILAAIDGALRDRLAL
jgi:mRNA interferase MazF